MCLQCHAGSAGKKGVCVECHMPKTMNALLFPARTHQIEVRPAR
jgi:formate-dependent nitrite reductase cytochrome c552 subunit